MKHLNNACLYNQESKKGKEVPFKSNSSPKKVTKHQSKMKLPLCSNE